MIPKSKCLDCERSLWDNKPPYQPKAGDNAICIFCGCMLEFDKNLKMIRPTIISEEMKASSSIIKFMNAIRSNPFNGDEDRYNIKELLHRHRGFH